MRRSRAAFAFAFASLALVLAVTVPPAGARTAPAPAPGVGIRLMQAPGHGGGDPRAAAYILDHLEPGSRVERHIEVSNGTDRKLQLDLYAAAADIVDGQFRAADGRTGNELAAWISVEPPVIVLDPAQRAAAVVHIAVPRDAPAGERYAAVLAEHAPTRVPRGDVAIVTRVGIRVYLSVGGSGAPRSDFSIDSLTATRDADGPRLTARVRNTGGRAVDLTGEARLTDGPDGLAAGPFQTRGATTVGPGERATIDVAVPVGLPLGHWNAHLTLRSGVLSRSMTAQVEFAPAAAATAVAPAPVGRRSPSVTAAPARRDGVFDRLRLFADALLDGMAFPIVMLIAVALFLVVQHRLDKRDSKIGLAPSDPDPLVRFE